MQHALNAHAHVCFFDTLASPELCQCRVALVLETRGALLSSSRLPAGGKIEIGSDTRVYAVGASSAIALGLGYVIIIALYAPIGAPPGNAQALLGYLGAHPIRWQWIIGLSVLTDIAFLPLAASLYLVFRNLDRYLTLLATGSIALFVVLDLAITWTNYSAAVALGSEYRLAGTEFQRSAIVAAATPISAVLHSELLFVYNSLTLGVGILLIGILMRRSMFGNAAAYLGIATGLASIVAVVGSFVSSATGVVIVLASCLTLLWAFVVGYRFLRLGLAR